MRRPALLAVLSFLLLFMQWETQAHALSHLGQSARSHQTAVLVPGADAACVECALLAAGTHAAHGHESALVAAAPVPAQARPPFLSRAADTPAFFRSRAPPFLA